MARNFPFDTLRQKALMELYEKEATVQLDNYLKSQKIEQSLDGENNVDNHSKLSEVLRKRLERNRVAVAGENKAASKLPPIKSKTMIIDNTRSSTLNDNEAQKSPSSFATKNFGMIPPNSKVRASLYSGFSREGKGRHQYLNLRKELGPQEKYSYPILSSWTYGWGIEEYAKKNASLKKRHGRVRIIDETFYGRTGVPIKQFDGMLQRSSTIF